MTIELIAALRGKLVGEYDQDDQETKYTPDPVCVAAADEIERLRAALLPFAEPHFMGDNYVRFAPRHLVAARWALREPAPHAYHSRMLDGACTDCGRLRADHP